MRNVISHYDTLWIIAMTKKASTKGKKPANLVQTIERTALILEILGHSPSGISLGELSEKVELPKGTTHRLITSLAYFDFIRQDPLTKNYQLGFKLVDLGNLLLSEIDLRSEARPYLIRLSESVKETIHLVVLDNDKALYIDKVNLYPQSSGLQMISRLGSRIDLHCSSVGKVMLAHMDNSECKAIISRTGLTKRTSNTITDPARLMRYLATVRKNGYAIDDEENEEGIRCVAAPIQDERGVVKAAMSISGPTTRITPERINTELKGRVRETANQISAKLGFREIDK